MKAVKYPKAVQEFTEKVKTETKEGDIKEIILYGSAATGKYREGESDIDLLIISKKKKIYDKILDIQTDVNMKYSVALSILYDTPQEIQKELNAGSPFIKEVIAKGVKLYGDNRRRAAAVA